MLNYKQFTQKINESLKQDILSFFDKSVDLFAAGDYELSGALNNENIKTLEEAYESEKLNQKLNKYNLKKDDIESTDYYEILEQNTYDIKFFTINKLNKSELENTEYIIIQFKSKQENKWSDLKCFKINYDIMDKFYEYLSTKNVEIIKGGKSYIYTTFNSGVEWKLKNIQDKTEEFKEIITKEEFNDITKNREIKIKIL